MTMPNPKLDKFFSNAPRWKQEFAKMRQLVLACGLDEGRKWGQPCYMRAGKNIVVIHGFKEYCAFLFFKGALMKDPKHILIQQTENVQSARQVRFTGVREIAKLASTLKAYIKEAIAVEASGAKVQLRKVSDYKVPEEFQRKLNEQPAVKAAFQALTPGRQRGYLYYFSSAKQAKTREARIEKYVPQILAGKGMED